MKSKINYVELTGNLVSDARVIDGITYVTLAIWNGEDKDGNPRPASFIDVTMFNLEGSEKLFKGQRVNVKGRMSSYKDKKNNHTKMSIVAFAYNIIRKPQATEQDINLMFE